MKKLLIVIALLASVKGFAQSESDRLKDDLSYALENHGPAEVLIIDGYGTAFSLDDSSSVCGDQYYAKIVEYPYRSQGETLGCETKASIFEKIGNKTYAKAAIYSSMLYDLYDIDYKNLPVTCLKDRSGDLFCSFSPQDCKREHIKDLCGILWTKVLFPYDKVKKVLGCESPISILDNVYSGIYKDPNDSLSNIDSALRLGFAEYTAPQ